jgi:hypothetical protein
LSLSSLSLIFSFFPSFFLSFFSFSSYFSFFPLKPGWAKDLVLVGPFLLLSISIIFFLLSFPFFSSLLLGWSHLLFFFFPFVPLRLSGWAIPSLLFFFHFFLLSLYLFPYFP